MHLIAGLALALRRMDRTVSLIVGLALTLSSRSAKVPPGQSVAGRPVVKSTGKPGDGSLELDGTRVQAVY